MDKPLKLKAQVLIFVFFLIFILGALAVALLQIWQSEVQIPSLQQGASNSFYIAQTGIELGKSQLRSNWDWAGMDANTDDIADESERATFGSGKYWVDIISRDDSNPAARIVTINAHGWTGISHQVIQVQLQRTEVNPGPPPVYTYLQIGWSWQQI
ncbi:MAG: hypothetical protein WC486_05730 [Candidatus Omnitrophota bacterium]